METKVCSKCGIEKSIEAFSWHNKSKGIRQSACKECVKQYNKEYKQKTRQNIQDIKKNLCCAKCGYNQSIWALDFHHRDPALKDEGIARLISNHYSTKRIMSEIEKCVVLCANCHREFHALEKEEGITIEQYLG